MEPIPIFRAAHLLPYLELLRKIGAPVERGLRQARLPTMLVDQPEAQLPLLPTLDFLTEMAYREGLDDLALRATTDFATEDLNPMLSSLIPSAPTLKAALEAFCSLARLEDAHLDIWIVGGESRVSICIRNRAPDDTHGTRHCELHAAMAVVATIRAFALPTWYPSVMAFRSTLPPGRYAAEQFPNTRLLTGQRTAWIDLPRTMLSLPPRVGQSARAARLGSESVPQAPTEPAGDFPGSLKQVLKAYLREGYPDISLAAEIANTSVRTLQRQLTGAGLSYSELVQQARFDAAAHLLKDPARSIIDTAYEVGYEDPSNFARAFRRIAGVSPREYRLHYCPH